MADPRVIKATFSDWKPVKTRSALQIILEVPIEKTEEVMQMLGVPIPGQERWVAVALLDKTAGSSSGRTPDFDSGNAGSTPAPASKRWADLSRAQQAGILCADPQFITWLKSTLGVTEVVQFVRNYCQVDSRSEIDGNRTAERCFDRLVAEFRASTGQMAEER